MELLLRDTFLEVNLDNIIYNMKNIKEMVGEEVAIAAVVKANGYGHGAVGVAQELMENGADYLAVATLTEALDLRRHFSDYKIFIMGFTPDKYLEHVVKNDIIQTIFSYRQAEILNDYGNRYNKIPVVHIKYDTGFNRLGFRDSKESIDEIEKISKLPNLNVEGIFSHLALTNKEEDEKQYRKLVKVIESLEERGIKFKYKHIEDSISAVDYPEFRMNMISLGQLYMV
ncbi:alanine racemase [Tissierella sp. P1]|uniref:alanine racemase n=1 Tax=Tissierella sp. P1 TaxID=1280483 RepID=UPI001914337E|nr:alanine racemase [Tissierella sp. P1]